MTARPPSVVLALLVALWGVAPAAAHPLDLGYLRIADGDEAMDVELDLHVHVAARLLGVDPSALDASAVARSAPALLARAFSGGAPATERGACRWIGAPAAARRDTTVHLAAHARCPAQAQALRWALPFVASAQVAPAFQLLVRARLAGRDQAALVDRGRPELALVADRPARGLGSFVWTGVEHIGATPGQWRDAHGWRLPDGLDHLLFVLALLLVGGQLRALLGVVSGFTLGHTITLALATLHLVRVPAAVIEPAIALSIALVGADALRRRPGPPRWPIAAAFGLVHGFGFAGALDELALPAGELARALVGYNLGVELGQLAIIAAAGPLVFLLHRHRGLAPVRQAAAAAIVIAGLAWFVARLIPGA